MISNQRFYLLIICGSLNHSVADFVSFACSEVILNARSVVSVLIWRR